MGESGNLGHLRQTVQRFLGRPQNFALHQLVKYTNTVPEAAQTAKDQSYPRTHTRIHMAPKVARSQLLTQSGVGA